jgi:hypothetical protein
MVITNEIGELGNREVTLTAMAKEKEQTKKRRERKVFCKNEIEQWYVVDCLKMREIAEKLNCSVATISKRIKLWGFKPNLDSKYIGKEFGMLTPISRCENDKHSHPQYTCMCRCGGKLDVLAYCLTEGNTTSCGCLKFRKGELNPCYQGYKGISKTLWSSLRIGAEVRNLSFNISIEFAWELYEKQGRKCVVSGVDISFSEKATAMSGTTASLDRIDSTLGYTEDNVQWLHKKVNILKMAMPEDDFIAWCHQIASHSPNRKPLSSESYLVA